MDTELILTRLQQLTGNLQPGDRTTAAELLNLRRSLAEHLKKDPALTVFGQRFHHDDAQHLDSTAKTIRSKFTDLEQFVATQPEIEETTTGSPLVFRRETEFHSNLLGNSVPSWGLGMAATRSFGPFID